MKRSARQKLCDGRDLREMFALAAGWLEREALVLNALNVFPVPDGDTGTNMLLTIRATLEEAYRSPGNSAEGVARALAQGALMGARGNSGVILSQVFRGLAQGLAGKDRFGGEDLVAALDQAVAMAYQGVPQPVEGTMLTVIREAADAARSAGGQDVVAVLEATVKGAQESVARTPALLPVLQEAGVVDAGGLGLSLLLQGALSYLQGGTLAEAPSLAREYARPVLALEKEAPRFGYCTEFLLQGRGLDAEGVKQKLGSLGESVLVVGDQSTLRAHLHTLDPGAALSYATSLGSLLQVKVENMEEQHRHFLALQGAPSGVVSPVVVVSGEGLAQVFLSLGARAIVPGGQTMNPSVQELLEAVEAVPTPQVILLPNNSNIIPTARQVQLLSGKEVEVVPTRSIPQGVAALLAFNPQAPLQANAAAMERASAAVRTGEVTTAVRSLRWNGLSVKKGQAIGLLDGELVEAGASRPGVVQGLLSRMGLGEGRMVTLYYGADTDPGEAEGVLRALKERFPGQEVEVVAGGQPHYHYIISVE